MRFVPALITMATPRPARIRKGSAQEPVVSINTAVTNITAMTTIFCTSLTVLVVASAVETALPVTALLSPIISRISLTASILLFSAMVRENSAFPSL